MRSGREREEKKVYDNCRMQRMHAEKWSERRNGTVQGDKQKVEREDIKEERMAKEKRGGVLGF